MARKIFRKGEKVIFRPKDKYSVVDLQSIYAGDKVKVYGPAEKDENNWDYNIIVRKHNTSQRVISCKADELVRI